MVAVTPERAWGLPVSPVALGGAAAVLACALAAGITGGAIIGWFASYLPAGDDVIGLDGESYRPPMAHAGLLSSALLAALLAWLVIRRPDGTERAVMFAAIAGALNPATLSIPATLFERLGYGPVLFAVPETATLGALPVLFIGMTLLTAIVSVPLGVAFGAAFSPTLTRAAALRKTNALPHLVGTLRHAALLLVGAAVLTPLLIDCPLKHAIVVALSLALVLGASSLLVERRRRAFLARAVVPPLRRVPLEGAHVPEDAPRLALPATHAIVADGGASYRDRPVALYLVD